MKPEDMLQQAPTSKASRARFITFEGGEGVGKSTQVKRLLQNLQRHDIEAVRTREPGGTPKAEAIRSFILQGRSESWGPGAEAVLFAAARLDHVNQLIAPQSAQRHLGAVRSLPRFHPRLSGTDRRR